MDQTFFFFFFLPQYLQITIINFLFSLCIFLFILTEKRKQITYKEGGPKRGNNVISFLFILSIQTRPNPNAESFSLISISLCRHDKTRV